MKNNTPRELACIMHEFIQGVGKDWDWDNFTSVEQKNALADSIRNKMSDLPVDFPPEGHRGYCNSEGVEYIRKVAVWLQSIDKFPEDLDDISQVELLKP